MQRWILFNWLSAIIKKWNPWGGMNTERDVEHLEKLWMNFEAEAAASDNDIKENVQ